MQREYNLLLLQQNLLMKEAENIFGEQSIAKAARAVEVYREAIRQYKMKNLKGDAPQAKFSPFSFLSGGLSGYKKQLEAYEKGIGALNNITIKTVTKKRGCSVGAKVKIFIPASWTFTPT